MNRSTILSGLKYHPEMLRAWAEGQQLQWQRFSGEWVDFNEDYTMAKREKLRVKPKFEFKVSGKVVDYFGKALIVQESTRWIATSESGLVRAFVTKPNSADYCWYAKGEQRKVIQSDPNEHWRESLQEV